LSEFSRCPSRFAPLVYLLDQDLHLRLNELGEHPDVFLDILGLDDFLEELKVRRIL